METIINTNALTIVLPTYNRAERLNNSLRNYLDADKSEEIEFIVIDNNSNDNTKQVIENIQYDYHSIKIRYIKNRSNVGACRNIFIGFLEVKTEYFMILTDDDLITKGFFKETLFIIKEYKNIGSIIHLTRNIKEGNIYPPLEGCEESVKREKSGKDAYHIAHRLSGIITGLTFKTSAIDIDKWSLDNSIYPQIRLNCNIALEYDIVYVKSLESVLIPSDNDPIMSIVNSRTIDMGILERIRILEETYINLKDDNREIIFHSLLSHLLRWAVTIYCEIYKINKKKANVFLNSLINESVISGSMPFWILVYKKISKNKKILLIHKLPLWYKFIFCSLKSLASRDFYLSLQYLKKINFKL